MAGYCLDTDDQYLYLFWGTLGCKRYLLSSGAISDIGNPIPGGSAAHTGSVHPSGMLLESDGDGNLYTAVSVLGGSASANGSLTSSFYDFDTPTANKSFKSVEFTMNSGLDPTSIQLQYRMDAVTNPLNSLTVQVSPSGNTLIAYFPTRTIGHRVQLVVSLIGSKAPDIASWSILATLARTWTVTVACRRDQHTRNPGDQPDPQGATAQQLQANIQNAYEIAGGNVVLWIPDPTVVSTPGNPGGVSQVNAQIQDYKKQVNSSPGPGLRSDAAGTPDQEADIQLTLTEVL